MNRFHIAFALAIIAASPGAKAEPAPNSPLAALTAAANQGDVSAQVALALKYDQGQDVPKDKTEAFKWLLKAATQGHAEAQYLVGNSYKAGDGVLKDEAEGLAWRRKSADNGYVPAQLDLGYDYLHGTTVQQNTYEAVKLFRAAAAKNNALAQNMLGEAYAAGRGVDRDDREAQQWFAKAAAQGLPVAQFNLGLLYMDSGAQTKSDPILGYMWLDVAARQNDSAAAFARNAAIQHMSKADIKTAENLARACVTSHYAQCGR